MNATLTPPALTTPAATGATGALPARRTSPSAARSGGARIIFARQTRSELLKLLRAPDFVAPVVLLPVVLFALFGSPSIGITTDEGIAVGPLLAASFTAYGVLGIALFTFGEAVAAERGQGWLRLVRATPLPGWAFLSAKLTAGVALVGIFLAVMIPAATLLGVRLDAVGWVRLGIVVAIGGLALAPIGFLVGFLVRPSAAGAVALLTYLPLSYASGMWTPISELPDVIQRIAPFLPTYHLTELAHLAVGVPTSNGLGHAAFLAGTFVVTGGLAVLAYRRVVGRQFA
jgi:ABC-2 type transport system permease protein